MKKRVPWKWFHKNYSLGNKKLTYTTAKEQLKQ